MQDLLGLTLERASHEKHLPASINASQQAALPQTMAKSLFADREWFRAGDLLGYLIAGRRIQEYVASGDPANPCTHWPPSPPRSFAPPAPGVSVFWRPAAPVREMRPTIRERRPQESRKPPRWIAGLLIRTLLRRHFVQCL